MSDEHDAVDDAAPAPAQLEAPNLSSEAEEPPAVGASAQRKRPAPPDTEDGDASDNYEGARASLNDAARAFKALRLSTRSYAANRDQSQRFRHLSAARCVCLVAQLALSSPPPRRDPTQIWAVGPTGSSRVSSPNRPNKLEEEEQQLEGQVLVPLHHQLLRRLQHS